MAFRIGRKFAYHTYPEPNNIGAIVSNRQEGTLSIPGQPTLQFLAGGPFDLMGVVISPKGIGDFAAVANAYFYATDSEVLSAVRFQLIGIQGGLTVNGVDPAVGFYQANDFPLMQPIVAGAMTSVLLDTGGFLPAPNLPLAESINMAALPAFNETRSLPPAGSPPVAHSTNFPAANGKVWFGLRIFLITGSDITLGPSPFSPTGGPIGTFFAQEVG